MTTTNDTPTAAETLEDVTLDQLVGLLEAIAIVKHERKILALPRYHQLNGCTFFLDRDGALAIDERDGRRPLVKLTPDEVYGMLIFLRLPGVATLIERLEAQRQARCWADYETDTAEEAVRLAAAR
jgi:hypothetical protein